VHNILAASHIQSVIVTQYSIKIYGFIDDQNKFKNVNYYLYTK
jgi:hypothetical protein